MTQDNQKPEVQQIKRPSALGAWFLASRPKTLTAAASPVAVALAMAFSDVEPGAFRWIPAICCVAFAVLAQIAANFVNDYADYQKGADGEERKGPARAVANGWIKPRTMLIATFLTLGLACCFGLATLPYGGWRLIVVGLVSCIFCLLYSAGPLPLAYIGLGDVLVISFFGFVAVGFTYYLQTGTITSDVALLGIAYGFAVDNILVANNYRDRDEDRANRKFTLIALFGERFGRYFYFGNGLIVLALLASIFQRRGLLPNSMAIATLLVYFAFHLQAWIALWRIRSGKGLIKILALSSRNLVVLAVFIVFTLL